MKKLNLKAILLFVSVAILSSCSSDDKDDVIITGDYFPSTENSIWNYDVTDTNGDMDSSDQLTVETSSPFKLEANSGTGANGYMNALLINGTLTRGASTLSLNGSIDIPIDGIEDFAIDYSNAKLYDLNANNNEILTSIDGSFSQDLDGVTLNFTYTLDFTKIKDLNSLKVNGVTYQTVTASNISLSLSVSTNVEVNGVEKTLSILDTQEILSIDSYFGENVGLLKSESKLNYSLNDSTIESLKDFDIDLGLESQSNTNTQTLKTFLIK